LLHLSFLCLIFAAFFVFFPAAIFFWLEPEWTYLVSVAIVARRIRVVWVKVVLIVRKV